MGLFRRRPSTTGPKLVLVSDPAGYDEELRRIRDVAANNGRWRPAAELLDRTGEDWDTRAFQVQVLANTTRSREWLDAWRKAEPTEPDALVVAFAAEVARAWEARGGPAATDLPYDAYTRMYEVLDGIPALGDEATKAAPEDPVPWVSMLSLAILQDQDRAGFDAIWAKVVDRCPDLRQAYVPALQYLSERWHGSHEEMFAFARAGAAAAPAGSPLAVLPVQAHLEYCLRETEQAGQSTEWLAEYWRSAETAADLDAAVAVWATEDGDDDEGYALEPEDRSMLAAGLCLAERWDEAREQFEAVDHRVFEWPWRFLPPAWVADAHRKALAEEDDAES